MKDYKTHHKAWSKAQVKFLLENLHLPTEELSRALGRTEAAIMQKIPKITPTGETRSSIRRTILNKISNGDKTMTSVKPALVDIKHTNGVLVPTSTETVKPPVNTKGSKEDSLTINMGKMKVIIDSNRRSITIDLI